MAKNKPMLSVKDLRCGYQDTEILHGISFDVFPNEKLCILGPNGCGKTTLLRTICQLLPFQGKITACEHDIRSAKRIDIARIMAYMSQMNSVYFPYTVYETVMMGRYPHQSGVFSQTCADDRQIVSESMKQTGVWDLKDRLLTELSGGQLQRVMLAKVFAQAPDIILLDEPMNHLDLKYQIELMEYLNQWVKVKNRCVVSVLHDINMAFFFADQILVMEEGNCVTHAPAKDFPLDKINQIYGMDICGYMQQSLRLWE